VETAVRIVHPPQGQRLEEFLAAVEGSLPKGRDAVMFTNLIRLAYRACLKSGNILPLTVNQARLKYCAALDPHNRFLRSIIAESRPIVEEQLAYLESSGYQITDDSLLFQADKTGAGIHRRKLERYLKATSWNFDIRFCLGKIQQAGVCYHADRVREATGCTDETLAGWISEAQIG
jgi:hypothetical protein